MKPIEFFAVVVKMREAQKKYFALPSGHPDKQIWLSESKRIISLTTKKKYLEAYFGIEL